MQLNSAAPVFKNELDGLLDKLQQLRQAAQPFIALRSTTSSTCTLGLAMIH